MTETLRKVCLLCFRIFQVWKNFMDERLGGGGGCHVFPSKIFWLTALKNYVGTSMLQKISSVGESLWRRDGGINFLRQKLFVPQCQKILSFGKILVSKFFMHRRGASWFYRKFFVSHDQKVTLGSPSVFQNISGMEKSLWIKMVGGLSRFSV